MKKQFFFLVGMPRTGNTLLSVLLNQNPKIKVSTNSILPDIVYSIDSLKNSLLYKNFPLEKNLNNVLKNVFDNFYFDWNCEYVIDRGHWGTTVNMNILKKIFDNNIKMIVLKRPFLEVLASYINVIKSNVKLTNIEKYIDEELYNNTGSIIRSNSYIYNNIKYEKDIKFHIVDYDDLVNNTKKVVNNIYEFLEIPKFNHYFTNLDQYNIEGQKYDDTVFEGNIDFHTIRTNKIEKNKYSYKEVLPKSVIEKYKNMDKELYDKISNFNSK